MQINEILMSERGASVLSMIIGNTNVGEFQDVPFATIVRARIDKDAHFHSECYLSLNYFQMDALKDDVFLQQYKNIEIAYAIEGQKLVEKLAYDEETDYDDKVVWLPMDALEERV